MTNRSTMRPCMLEEREPSSAVIWHGLEVGGAEGYKIIANELMKHDYGITSFKKRRVRAYKSTKYEGIQQFVMMDLITGERVVAFTKDSHPETVDWVWKKDIIK